GWRTGVVLAVFDRLAHADHAVDLPALLDQEALAGDVAVHHARALDLRPILRYHRPADLPADDRLAGDQITFHFPALGDQHLAAGAHGADHSAFDFHHPLRRDVADHAHPGPDDRERRFGVGA